MNLVPSDAHVCLGSSVRAHVDRSVPHWPIGLFYQATAFRSSLDGVLNGIALMYNVRRV